MRLGTAGAVVARHRHNYPLENMKSHLGRLLCGLLTTSLCLSACGSADSEYEAKLLRNMENIGKTMQEARSCGLDDQHLPGHSSAYSESFALAERTGFTSKKKLEAAYRKGVESAAAKPPSEA